VVADKKKVTDSKAFALEGKRWLVGRKARPSEEVALENPAVPLPLLVRMATRQMAANTAPLQVAVVAVVARSNLAAGNVDPLRKLSKLSLSNSTADSVLNTTATLLGVSREALSYLASLKRRKGTIPFRRHNSS